jgi:hypothetical protein
LICIGSAVPFAATTLVHGFGEGASRPTMSPPTPRVFVVRDRGQSATGVRSLLRVERQPTAYRVDDDSTSLTYGLTDNRSTWQRVTSLTWQRPIPPRSPGPIPTDHAVSRGHAERESQATRHHPRPESLALPSSATPWSKDRNTVPLTQEGHRIWPAVFEFHVVPERPGFSLCRGAVFPVGTAPRRRAGGGPEPQSTR